MGHALSEPRTLLVHGQPQHDGSDFLDIMVLPKWMSTVASVGMAIGPSLVYADQAYSIVRKKYALSSLLQTAIPKLKAVTEMRRGFRVISVLYCASASL